MADDEWRYIALRQSEIITDLTKLCKILISELSKTENTIDFEITLNKLKKGKDDGRKKD